MFVFAGAEELAGFTSPLTIIMNKLVKYDQDVCATILKLHSSIPSLYKIE